MRARLSRCRRGWRKFPAPPGRRQALSCWPAVRRRPDQSYCWWPAARRPASPPRWSSSCSRGGLRQRCSGCSRRRSRAGRPSLSIADQGSLSPSEWGCWARRLFMSLVVTKARLQERNTARGIRCRPAPVRRPVPSTRTRGLPQRSRCPKRSRCLGPPSPLAGAAQGVEALARLLGRLELGVRRVEVAALTSTDSDADAAAW